MGFYECKGLRRKGEKWGKIEEMFMGTKMEILILNEAKLKRERMMFVGVRSDEWNAED